jgi:hypothetical protein
MTRPNPYEGGYAAARPCNGQELLSVAGLSPLPYWELFLGRPPVVKRHTTPVSGFFLFSRFTGPGVVSTRSRALT